MTASSLRRRFREHFGISAPRMTVTTRLRWWERGAAIAAAGLAVAGLVWLAFDMGEADGRASARQSEAASNRGQVVEAAQSDAVAPAMRHSTLESDLAMSRGAEQALSRQVADLSAENVKLREEILVLKRLLDDGGRASGPRRLR